MHQSKKRASRLALFSPAKINLYLHVKGKRPDGFHNLKTLMQAIDLGDTLTFEPAQTDRLTLSDPTIAADSSNTILRATALFREKTKIPLFCHIAVQKRIPPGGGLGGGSSNCATTLYACNHLAGNPVSEKKLQAWSAEISSDAPFFFSKGRALCSARGEIVEEREEATSAPLYLCFPSFGVSTKAVFERLQLKEEHVENDLEETAFLVEPRLRAFRAALLKRYRCVLMSGSGSSFICKEPKEKADGRAIRFIRRSEGWYTGL